jgi:tetratricopeptide (TPR) repeat protein
MIRALLILALSQPSPQKLYQEGTAAFEAGDFARAEALYQQALRGKPAELEFARALGASIASQGRFADALPHLERACRHTTPALPNRGVACYQWGRTLYFLQRPADAIEAYGMARQASPFTAQMYLGRAQALDALGQVKEADYDYRHALAESALRNPESAVIQLAYGNFLARQGNHEAALWQFDQAIRKTPHEQRLWQEKAKSLLALGRAREAADALERALAHGSRNRETMLLLSRVYQGLGQNEKAQSYLDEANGKRNP